ncbi:hypothetical protein MBANPS3_009794 [Mucor bainieri]
MNALRRKKRSSTKEQQAIEKSHIQLQCGRDTAADRLHFLQRIIRVRPDIENLLCDHDAGKPRPNPGSTAPATTASTATTASVPTAPAAKRASSLQIVYKWHHPDRSPSSVAESTSNLSVEVKNWINEQVDNNMDWKSIKKLLRIGEKELIKLENDATISSFPMALLVNYQDVKDAVNTRVMKLAKKTY